MSRTYRVHEFAALAGVTIKALHHYDRRGLLQPKRTAAGYRVYEDDDLLRLQQIVGLKFIGLSLIQIRDVLHGGVLPLRDALRAQEAALGDRVRQIDRARKAIAQAQQRIDAGETSHAAILAELIQVLAMPHMSMLKQYFSDDAWTRWTAKHRSWPSAAVREFYTEVQQHLDEDPAGPEAQRLAMRWMELMQAESDADPDIRTALRKAAIADRDNAWAFLQAAMPDVDVRRVVRFLGTALWARWESPEGSFYTPRVRPKASAARAALLKEFDAALTNGGDSERLQQLLARWDDMTDEESGGEPDIKREMERAMSRWREWPPGMKRWVASTYDMPVDAWERVMAFLERRRQASGVGNQDSGQG
jgi:MerR family transcriptional regulator, thiopeptide resistance regulator